jgi:hypothetical protein
MKGGGKYMIYILYAVALVLVMYGLLVGISNLPFTGTLLAISILLCMIMIVFMGHGEGRRRNAVHKH